MSQDSGKPPRSKPPRGKAIRFVSELEGSKQVVLALSDAEARALLNILNNAISQPGGATAELVSILAKIAGRP
jgi:hypothetical protein